MKCDKMVFVFGRIAQLVRAFASHARGHGFESPCLHQISIVIWIKLRWIFYTLPARGLWEEL